MNRRNNILSILMILAATLYFFTMSMMGFIIPISYWTLIGILESFNYDFLKPLKRLYYNYIIKHDLIVLSEETLSPLMSYPCIIWLELSAIDEYVSNTYEDFTKIYINQIDTIAENFTKSLIKKSKPLTIKQLHLRKLFHKWDDERELYHRDRIMDDILSGKVKIKFN